MKILKFTDSSFEENSYMLVDQGDVTIIDPGFNYEKIDSYLISNNLTISRVLLTHGHIDHIGELDKIVKKYPETKVYINEKDIPCMFDSTLNVSKLMGMTKTYSNKINIIPVLNKECINGFTFYSTPGHTSGSSVILKDGHLFTGDTLFKGTIGRTDLPTGDMNQIYDSLEFIAENFKKDIKILPGHYQVSTIGDEIKNNPFMKKSKRK